MSTPDEQFSPDGITPRQFWLMGVNGNMKAGQLIAIQQSDGTLREVVVTDYDAGPPFRIETTNDPDAIKKAREAARANPVGTVVSGLIGSTPDERADHLRAMTADAAQDDAYATVNRFVQTRGKNADHGLRERIARMLHTLFGDCLDDLASFDDMANVRQDSYRRNADAVIRKLRLRREDDDEVPPFWPTKGEYRYVTDWETDE